MVIGLLLLIGSAAGYFIFVRKPADLNSPRGVVTRYINAISDGNVTTMKALFVPGRQPPQQYLDFVSGFFSSGMIKYKNPEYKNIKENPAEAEIELTDMDIVISIAGQTATQKLSAVEPGHKALVYKLKYGSGKWLLYEAPLPLSGYAPNVPTTPFNGG